MFGMFPFMFNGSSNVFGGLFNDIFLNSIINQMSANNVVNRDIDEKSYNVDIKDCGDYYLMKGYLPGVSPRDLKIDFEKGKAILTIRKRQVYSNGLNIMMNIVQTGGDLVKTFYVDEIDKNKIGAAFEKNILLLTLPKKKKIVEQRSEENATIIDVDSYNVE